MKKKLFICVLLMQLGLNANAFSNFQLLLREYCKNVAEAFLAHDKDKLENCISEYSPCLYADEGPYVSINGQKILLTLWEDLMKADGSEANTSNVPYSFLPPKIDLYIAQRQEVKANATPVLRKNYDYKYAEVFVKANSHIKLKTKDYGKWRIVAACVCSAQVSVEFVDHCGSKVLLNLSPGTPADILEWKPATEEIDIIITNKSDRDVSVFLAKN